MAIREGSRVQKLFLIFVFLIPFQRRFYQSLKKFSASLIDPSWTLPPYFEIHLDWYLADAFLVAMLLYAIQKAGWRLFVQQEKKYLTLFLALALCSIFFSTHPTYLLHYWRWLHLALPALIVYVVGQTIVIHFHRLAQVVVASSLVQCAIALAQYIYQHSLGLKWLGEPTIVSRHFLGASFPMAGGARTLFDSLFHVVRETSHVIRAYGTFQHPNILGGFLVVGLCMTAYLFVVAKKRGWLSVMMVIQLLTLMTTFSRSALFAWIAAMGVWIALDYWKSKKIHPLAWLSLGGLALAITCFYPQLFARGGVVSYNAVAEVSDQSRLQMNEVGHEMVKHNPWWGTGFNSYYLTAPQLVEDESPLSIHNLYLQLGVEVGVIGLIPLLIYWGVVMKRGWEKRESLEARICFVMLFAFLLIGLVDFYHLYNQQARLMFFLITALLASQSRQSLQEMGRSPNSPVNSPMG